MNDVWNLDSIYTGFEDAAFSQDFEKLKQTVEAVIGDPQKTFADAVKNVR